MNKNGPMQRKAITAAVASALAALAFSATPAYADLTSELKDEIAQQRAQIEAQRLRLEAMEKKLEAVSAEQAKAAQQAAAPQAVPAQQVASAKPEQPAVPGKPAPSFIVSADWEPGYTFMVTPKDTVTLYGLIDATISNITNANAAGDHKLSYQTAWFSGNRWGIAGRHGIGDGNTAVIFKLESEFDYRTGALDTDNVIFNRDAWVGFQSDGLGKLTFGRQNALARDFTGIYGDPYGSAKVTLEEGGYTNTNNFKQLIFYAASATGTRYDRGAVWKKDFGGFVAGLGYQFGGVAGKFSQGSTVTAAFGYNAPNDLFHLAGFLNNFDVNGLKHKAYSFGGNLQLGPVVRLNSGYYKYDSEQGNSVGNRKDHAYTISSKFTPDPKGPFEFDLGYQLIQAKNAGVNAAGNVLVPYADASSVTTTTNGNKKTVYGSVFYHFDRRSEVYFVTDYMKLADGYKLAVTNGHNNQLEIGVGMRIKF